MSLFMSGRGHSPARERLWHAVSFGRAYGGIVGGGGPLTLGATKARVCGVLVVCIVTREFLVAGRDMIALHGDVQAFLLGKHGRSLERVANDANSRCACV
jgi:hypothetical protein